MMSRSILIIILIYLTILLSKPNIAVLDLKPINIQKNESIILSEVLRSKLYNSNAFRLMNRKDMKDIMGEQIFQNSGLCDDTGCLIEIGNLLKVNYLVSGSVGKIDSTYSITIKMINIETSENLRVLNYQKENNKQLLFQIMEQAAMDLSGRKISDFKNPEFYTIDNHIDLNDELVLHLDFDGNSLDYSRYKNNCNINNGVFTKDQFKINNNALLFNGNDTYALCDNDPILELNQEFSINIVFKINELSNKTMYLLFKENSYSILISSKNLLNITVNGYIKESLKVDYKLKKNIWYNLVVTCDLKKGYLKVFIDNLLISNFNLASIRKRQDFSSNLQIGNGFKEKYYHFNGVIDVVRLYRRALIRSEIDSLNIIKGWSVNKLIKRDNFDYGKVLSSDTHYRDSGPLETINRFNQEGKAGYFNGKFAYQEYKSAKYHFNSSEPFSISFWFKQDSTRPEGYTFFDKSTHGRSKGIILDSKGKDHPGQQLRWLANYKPIYGKSKYLLNKWHHLALTYDGKSSKIYLNGKLEGASDYKVDIEYSDSKLIFGATQNKMKDNNKLFHGSMDDVLIYQRCLNIDEINLLYHQDD